VTFWLLGGQNIILDGGGVIDGAGQVRLFLTDSLLLVIVFLKAWWDALWVIFLLHASGPSDMNTLAPQIPLFCGLSVLRSIKLKMF